MGRQARDKRERREQGRSWQQEIQAARKTWLGKIVAFDAGRGDGIQRGCVTALSEEGILTVECLPASRGRVVAVAVSLSMVDRLTIVETGH